MHLKCNSFFYIYALVTQVVLFLKKSMCYYCNNPYYYHYRPLFRGDSGVDQLVEIVSTVGPFTPADFQLMGIDQSFPLVDVVAKYRSPIRRLSNSTFEERFVASTGLRRLPSDMITSLFRNLFQYVPESRWNSEKTLDYFERHFFESWWLSSGCGQCTLIKKANQCFQRRRVFRAHAY